jgi:hypothetical protein
MAASPWLDPPPLTVTEEPDAAVPEAPAGDASPPPSPWAAVTGITVMSMARDSSTMSQRNRLFILVL